MIDTKILKQKSDMVNMTTHLLRNLNYLWCWFTRTSHAIVRSLAGYSMGRADLVRRAMSKKKLNNEEERKTSLCKTDEKGQCSDRRSIGEAWIKNSE